VLLACLWCVYVCAFQVSKPIKFLDGGRGVLNPTINRWIDRAVSKAADSIARGWRMARRIDRLVRIQAGIRADACSTRMHASIQKQHRRRRMDRPLSVSVFCCWVTQDTRKIESEYGHRPSLAPSFLCFSFLCVHCFVPVLSTLLASHLFNTPQTQHAYVARPMPPSTPLPKPTTPTTINQSISP
jgi:hypothetical protein